MSSVSQRVMYLQRLSGPCCISRKGCGARHSCNVESFDLASHDPSPLYVLIGSWLMTHTWTFECFVHSCAIVSQLSVMWNISAQCHVVSIASHRFFRPNLRPSLNSGDQTESIGTNFVQPALKLGLGQFLGLLFNKMIFFWPNSHWNLFTSGLNYSLIHFQPFPIPRKILKKTCQLWLSRTVCHTFTEI